MAKRYPKRALALLLTAAATTWLTGCPRLTKPSDGHFDPEACTELVVPTAFGLRWQRFNHRIAKWGVALEEDRNSDCGPDAVLATAVGGGFSKEGAIRDRPRVEFAAQRITTNVDQAGVARLSINAVIDATGAADGEIEINRDERNLQRYDHIAAFIDGISFDTTIEQAADYPPDYDPGNGYTSRGFGASVEVADVDEDEITLRYRIRFETGAAPDRIKLNQARPHARIGARLDVLLIGSSDEAPATEPIEYEVAFRRPTIGKKRQTFPDGLERTVSFAASEPGLLGWSSFDFALDFENTCSRDRRCPAGDRCSSTGTCEGLMGPPGDYVRELSLKLEPLTSDDEENFDVRVDGFASNNTESVGFQAMTYTFSARVTHIPLGVEAETIEINGAFSTGEARFPF